MTQIVWTLLRIHKSNSFFSVVILIEKNVKFNLKESQKKVNTYDCPGILLHSKVNIDLVVNHWFGLDLEKVLCHLGKLVLQKKKKKDKFLTSKLPLTEVCCSIGFTAGASGSTTRHVRFYLSECSTWHHGSGKSTEDERIWCHLTIWGLS